MGWLSWGTPEDGALHGRALIEALDEQPRVLEEHREADPELARGPHVVRIETRRAGAATGHPREHDGRQRALRTLTRAARYNNAE